ncbi:MAG: type transport system permease protein [Solirubrobacteraceae bacterium]|jgi:ABC-2 type transport system permease protein|nr:type transport system permease protein [Solirubrobacteraceae bacterium]
MSVAPDLPAGPRGTPIRGPSAVGVDLRRFVNLTRTIAATDFKLRFYGSVLGYVWQLLRPLLLFGVLYAFFTAFVRIKGVHLYGVVLLMGIMLFTFLGDATQGSVSSLVDREILVRKIQFPRLAVPLASVLIALFNLALNLVIVLVFLFASGGGVHVAWLEVPLLLLALVAFATGISMLLSALYVRYRDVKPIWDVLLQALYFVSLILIPWEAINDDGHHATLSHVVMINPLAAIVQQMRHALIDPTAPTAAAAAGSWELLLVPAGIVVALVAIGYRVFDRAAPYVAEEL